MLIANKRISSVLINKMPHPSKGFTLPEMLIALALNALLLVSLLAVFSANMNRYNTLNNTDRLIQQLQVALQLMTNDIRRAGYWSNSATNISQTSNINPFQSATTDITLSGTTNCILFAYDDNNDGTLPSITNSADDERYGFRLSGTILQARPPGATYACNAAANNWENMTDPTTIQITNLSFTLNSTTVPIGQVNKINAIRSVDISITGRLTSNTAITKTLTQHVRIRNDKFIP